MADMQELIARLEAAEAGSLELDCEMGLFARTDGKGEVSDHFGTPCIRDAGGPYAPKPFTTSLDAALALMGRALPDWDWQITKGADEMALVCIQHSRRVSGPEVCAHTPALALCIAILRAIQHGYEAVGEVSPNLKAKAQGEGR